jgi:hypothetical protein
MFVDVKFRLLYVILCLRTYMHVNCYIFAECVLLFTECVLGF